MSALAQLTAVPRRLRRDSLLRNSAFIMGTTVVTSALGYVFWLAVARSFDADVTGRGSATTSALQAAAILTSAGAAAAMVEWLPRTADVVEWRERLTAGLVVATVGSALGALLAVAVLGTGLRVLPDLATPVGALLFVAGTVFFGLGLVLDYVAVSATRGGVMLARNVVASTVRVPLLLVPLPGTDDRVLSSWTVAGGLALLVDVAAFGVRRDTRSLRPAWGRVGAHLRGMAGSLVGQHLITVAAMLTTYLLPLLVVSRVSAGANAYFYATWMLGSIFFLVSPAVSTALFAEGAADPAAVHAHVRKAGLVIGALLALPILAYLLGGRLLLALFGPDYPDQGWLLLVVLTLSAIPDAVTNVGVAVLRSTDRLRQALWLNGGMLGATLVGSWLLLPRLGIVAVGVAWFAAQFVGAVWVVRTLRRG